MMKKLCLLSVLILGICALSAETFKPESYAEVDIKVLKATPENYKGKKIWYQSEYRGFKPEFPQFVEKEGFKSTKKYWLEVMPDSIPVFADKSDEMNKIIPGLKRDSVIKVYGEIKKVTFMRKKGEQGPEFSFYLDLDHLEVVSEAPEKKENEEKDRPPRRK